MLIVVICETEGPAPTEASLECIEEARDLAVVLQAQVMALVPGGGDEQVAPLAAHGATRVLLVTGSQFTPFSTDHWLNGLEPIVRELAPGLLLAPDSGQARAWLPRLALRWGVPLITRCLALWPGADGVIECTRPIYSGASHERVACPGATTLLATMAVGSRGLSRPVPGAQAEVITVHAAEPLHAPRDRVAGRLPPDPRTVDISEADRVVAGGLGVGSPEGLATLWQLADALGAALGGTRVLADRGWLPFERQIGSTGKTIAPQLYLAVGISGASQHTSGITGSDTVVVINQDRTAPMFGFADLGLVGDLHQIVPEVLRLLEEKSL